MDATMIVNCIGRVDVNKVVELGEALKAKLEAGNDIIIKDNNGTYLTAKMREEKFVTPVSWQPLRGIRS